VARENWQDVGPVDDLGRNERGRAREKHPGELSDPDPHEQLQGVEPADTTPVSRVPKPGRLRSVK
jgi:hypothetical protein